MLKPSIFYNTLLTHIKIYFDGYQSIIVVIEMFISMKNFDRNNLFRLIMSIYVCQNINCFIINKIYFPER
jgi:hypothetical protein